MYLRNNVQIWLEKHTLSAYQRQTGAWRMARHPSNPPKTRLRGGSMMSKDVVSPLYHSLLGFWWSWAGTGDQGVLWCHTGCCGWCTLHTRLRRISQNLASRVANVTKNVPHFFRNLEPICTWNYVKLETGAKNCDQKGERERETWEPGWETLEVEAKQEGFEQGQGM